MARALTIAVVVGALALQQAAVHATTCSVAAQELTAAMAVASSTYFTANEACLESSVQSALGGGAKDIDCNAGYDAYAAACTSHSGANCDVVVGAHVDFSGIVNADITSKVAACYPATGCSASEYDAFNAALLAETKTALEKSLTVTNAAVASYQCAAAAPPATFEEDTTAAAATVAPTSAAEPTVEATSAAPATTAAAEASVAPTSAAAATVAPTSAAAAATTEAPTAAQATTAPAATVASATSAAEGPQATTAAAASTAAPATTAAAASSAPPATTTAAVAASTAAPSTTTAAVSSLAAPTQSAAAVSTMTGSTAAPTACSIATEAVLADDMVALRTTFAEGNVGCLVSGLLSPPSTPISCRIGISDYQAACAAIGPSSVSSCDVVIEFDRRTSAANPWAHVKLLWPDCYPTPACSRADISEFEAEIIRVVEETASGNGQFSMELKDTTISSNTCYDTPEPTERTARPRLPESFTDSCRLKVNLGPVISSMSVPALVLDFEDALEALNVTVVVHDTNELDDGSLEFDVEISVAVSLETLAATVQLIEANKDFLVDGYEVFKKWGGSVEPAADCLDGLDGAAPAAASTQLGLAMAAVAGLFTN